MKVASFWGAMICANVHLVSTIHSETFRTCMGVAWLLFAIVLAVINKGYLKED